MRCALIAQHNHNRIQSPSAPALSRGEGSAARAAHLRDREADAHRVYKGVTLLHLTSLLQDATIAWCNVEIIDLRRSYKSQHALRTVILTDEQPTEVI